MPMRQLAGWLGVLPVLALSSPHGCHQARVRPQTAAQHYVYAEEDYVYAEGRRLQSLSSQSCEQVAASSSFAPIRIGYEFLDVANKSVDVNTKNYIVNTVVAKAVAFWSSTLQVRPALQPLTVNPLSTYCYRKEGDMNVCVDANPYQCDDVVFPPKYIRQSKVCTRMCLPTVTCSGACRVPGTTNCQCNATDWQAALSKGASYCCGLQTGLNCPTGCATNPIFTGGGNITVNGQDATQVVCEDKASCYLTDDGAGAVKEDMHLFVTIGDTAVCKASGADSAETVAYAIWCAKDQCDRPMFGRIHFCQSMINLSPAMLNERVSEALHELAHALGFSSSLFQYFRNAAGSPLFARQPPFYTEPVNSTTWSCTSGSTGNFKWPDRSGTTAFLDVSPKVLNIFSERDITNCGCPVGKSTMDKSCFPSQVSYVNASCVFRLTLPNLQREARDYFNCSALPGPELENQDTSDCQIIPSHWELRVLNGELMGAVTNAVPYLLVSRITLALFDDSGWYKVNYSMADTPVKGIHWGYKQGCAFAMSSKCIVNTTPVSKFFCSSMTPKQGCGYDRMAKATCDYKTQTPPIGPPFNYAVDSSTTMQGGVVQLDYCPSYQSWGASYQQCSNPGSPWDQTAITNNAGEVVSSNSRCLMGSFWNASAPAGVFPPDLVQWSGCYQVDCDPSGASYKVSIALGSPTGNVTLLGTCYTEGTNLSYPGFRGAILCAAPTELCNVPVVQHNKMGPAYVYVPPSPGPGSASASISSVLDHLVVTFVLFHAAATVLPGLT